MPADARQGETTIRAGWGCRSSVQTGKQAEAKGRDCTGEQGRQRLRVVRGCEGQNSTSKTETKRGGTERVLTKSATPEI